MRYALYVTRSAQTDLSVLDKKIASRIVDKLEFFVSTDNPLRFATRLRDSHYGTYRFRVGDYRAIFDVDEDGDLLILMILRVKHRKDVYRL